MRAIIIYGPTATGKTDLAIALAKKYDGEIISADSRQVYKNLDIATGKVSFGSKYQKHTGYWIVDGIRINGFDLVDPGQQFTAADFLKFAANSIARIIKAGKLPIVAGGTGFYIKALLGGIDSLGIPAAPKLREKLEKLTAEQLYKELEKVSPERARSMNESDAKNPRRLIRAIEIAMSPEEKTTTNDQLPTTNLGPQPEGRGPHGTVLGPQPEGRGPHGTVLGPQPEGRGPHGTVYLFLGLTAPNQFLYSRVDKWIEEHLAHGMIEETENLIKSGVDPKWLDQLGLYYRWITKLVLGHISKEDAIAKLRIEGHDFVKRQKTWFKQFKGIQLFDISQKNWRSQLEKTVEIATIE